VTLAHQLGLGLSQRVSILESVDRLDLSHCLGPFPSRAPGFGQQVALRTIGIGERDRPRGRARGVKGSEQRFEAPEIGHAPLQSHELGGEHIPRLNDISRLKCRPVGHDEKLGEKIVNWAGAGGCGSFKRVEGGMPDHVVGKVCAERPAYFGVIGLAEGVIDRESVNEESAGLVRKLGSPPCLQFDLAHAIQDRVEGSPHLGRVSLNAGQLR
jgi:hypothetical protein